MSNLQKVRIIYNSVCISLSSVRKISAIVSENTSIFEHTHPNSMYSRTVSNKRSFFSIIHTELYYILPSLSHFCVRKVCPTWRFEKQVSTMVLLLKYRSLFV